MWGALVTQASRKAEWERQVFTEFAKVAGLQVVPGSLESRPTPEPDILCELADRGRLAFELVNLADEGLMRTIAHTIRGETHGVWFGDPTLDLIWEKVLRKTYKTAHAMELLAYGDDTMLPYDVWAPTYEQRLIDLVEDSTSAAVDDPSRRTFQRLWVANLGPRSTARPVKLCRPWERSPLVADTSHGPLRQPRVSRGQRLRRMADESTSSCRI